MRALILAAALALLPLAATAQPAPETLVREYAGLPAVQQMMAAMFSPEASAAQLQATLPPGMNLTDDQLSRIGEIISAEMIDFQPRMEGMMIAAMVETFTEEEVQAMIDFYSSPVGASILLKTQPMFTSIMTQMGPEIQTRMMGRQAEIMQIIMAQ
jgi:hypothetical protein